MTRARRRPALVAPAVGRLIVVTGPPCAGKSTHVEKQRRPGDVVVDLDLIARAFGYPEHQIEWDDEHPAVVAARMARGHVIHALLTGRLVARAWIIDAKPERTMRPQYERASAKLITLDPGMDVCLERAADRADGTADRIRAWYADTTTTRGQELDIFE